MMFLMKILKVKMSSQSPLRASLCPRVAVFVPVLEDSPVSCSPCSLILWEKFLSNEFLAIELRGLIPGFNSTWRWQWSALSTELSAPLSALSLLWLAAVSSARNYFIFDIYVDIYIVLGSAFMLWNYEVQLSRSLGSCADR